MSSLYELSSAYQSIVNALENNELENEELIANLQEALSQIEGDIYTKGENIVKMVKHFEAQAEMVAQEIKRLQARKQMFENRVKVLREGLKGAMEVNDINKIPSALFNIVLTDWKDGSVILSVEPEQLPKEYQRIKIEADKVAIKADLKAGVVIDGAELEKVRTLMIK